LADQHNQDQYALIDFTYLNELFVPSCMDFSSDPIFPARFLTLEAFSHKSTDVATTQFSFEKHYTLNV